MQRPSAPRNDFAIGHSADVDLERSARRPVPRDVAAPDRSTRFGCGRRDNALDALASCFTEGNGRGKGLKFVGHADPRGQTDYNFALGQRRAGAVAQYVMARGVAEDRVESSSRGELDARGSDEASWQQDRNVEILLAGEGE
jgi:hypothetical protein